VHILLRVTEWDEEDHPSAAGERGQKRAGKRVLPDRAEHDVERLAAVGEVLARVVDEFFGADRVHLVGELGAKDLVDARARRRTSASRGTSGGA
jgi:hypothetical protein